MSDLGRKGLGEQVSEKITPQSQKTTGEKVGETLTGAYDQAAGAIQPDSEKSTTQKLGDSTRSGTNDAEGQGKGIVASVQETVGNLAGAASDTLKSASDSIAGTTADTKAAAADKTS